MPFNPALLEIGNLYTRPELADIWGYAGYQALGRGVFTPSGSKFILLFVTRDKQSSAIQFQDFLSGDYLHWEGEEGHGNDERIENAEENGEDILLFYRDIHHTPFRYYGRILRQYAKRNTSRPSEFIFSLEHDLSPQDDLMSAYQELSLVNPTEKELLVKARLGQGKYRDDLIFYWKGCAVTNIVRPDLLRASHIKPWRKSENDERLNPFNGLLLLTQYDLLFDRGYITFDDKGKLEASPSIKTLPPEKLGIDLNSKLRQISNEHLPFLEYHNENIFLRKTGN